MEKLKPEKAMAMLEEKGIVITIEQATALLEFLRAVANIIVADHLKQQNNQ